MSFKIRFLVAVVIVLLSYVYFRIFLFVHQDTLAYSVYLFLILASVVVAFKAKRHDITFGILYGLIFISISLIIIFSFFTSSLP